MINGDKIFAYSWNSCSEIDNLIDYLNTQKLTKDQYKKLEQMFDSLISAYSGMKEEVWGDDV